MVIYLLPSPVSKHFHFDCVCPKVSWFVLSSNHTAMFFKNNKIYIFIVGNHPNSDVK